MATHDGDRALAGAVVRGEPGAAEALFERVFDRIYRAVCGRLGGDHHAAQDVASETLLAGLRALPSYRGDAALSTWFYRIAARKIADLRRTRGAVLVPAGGDGDLEALAGTLGGSDGTILDRLADDETRRIVHEAVVALPARHRRILQWRYFEDESVRRVALRLQSSEKAAERRLARARAALAAALRRRGVRG
ncbi:MAG: sigma-70 family RNA polymerase sigma factor [Planctomycetes bacterium]|nr:sigma-70 family RNA polymerase sigma factor [Planctomycetota bacterium]